MCWFWIIVISVVIIAVYLICSGLLYKVEVTVKEKPLDAELEIHYKVGRGSHSSCSAYYDEMKELAKTATRIGIFYDDPRIVRTSNLRWIVGVISAVNGERIIDTYVLERLKRYRCIQHTIAQPEKAMVTEHPYKNALSLWLARRKVYEKVQQYQKHTALAGRPTIEILRDDSVQFILPLQNHESYVVPELRYS